MAEIQKVVAQAYKSADGALWNLHVQCPFCGFTHKHGAGSVKGSPHAPDDRFYGEKMAHCSDVKDLPMYLLVKEKEGA